MATDSSSSSLPVDSSSNSSRAITAVTPPPAGELTIVRDAVCTFCNCMCDDINLTVENNHIVAADRACTLGLQGLMQPVDSAAWLTHRAQCFIEGQPAALAAGYDLAARLLVEARAPLIYGMSHSTCEAQSKAVGLADWIGATIDTTSGQDGRTATIMALQTAGMSTCTLGEIRNRSDFVLYWGSNPLESRPRHTSRYSLDPVGMFIPQGRAGRTCVVVDICPTPSSAAADQFLQVKPNSDFEALWTLRALAKGMTFDADATLRETGVPLAAWQDLLARMKSAQYGVIFFGHGISNTRGGTCNSEAILRLTRELNAFTRFVARPMGGTGNVVGAENVLTWQTGFPFGVNLSRGYPRYSPGEYTAIETLARGEADAALLIGCDPLTEASAAVQQHLRSIPTIVIDAHDTPSRRAATVAFVVETFGIHTQGTVYRQDDIAIEIRPACTSEFPSELEVLTQIERRVVGHTPCA